MPITVAAAVAAVKSASLNQAIALRPRKESGVKQRQPLFCYSSALAERQQRPVKLAKLCSHAAPRGTTERKRDKREKEQQGERSNVRKDQS